MTAILFFIILNMQKNTIAIASVAAFASFVSLSGIMISQNVNAQDSPDNNQNRYERFRERQERFWGENFDEAAFESRYQIILEKTEAKQLEKEEKFNNSELSNYLGLTFEELKTLHQSGTTLREYVESNDLDITVVTDLMIIELTERLDEKLELGLIDQERYDEMIKNIEERVDRRLDGEGKIQRQFREAKQERRGE